tara:strand:+ start:337 stop:1044 length:708 start_codon:yes stop_codon:yes gene_type:complete
VSLKNWDNKTWLSSSSYIRSFNNFLLKQIKLNKNSQILDIGCGRGKILGSLSSKLSLKRKPIGLDIVNHKDKDKRIIFKKIDALRFLKKNKKKFDLILFKQTIHLFKIKDIKNILKLSKKMLNINGKIIIFTLDPLNNEIPTFSIMKKKLKKALIRDKKIIRSISYLFNGKLIRGFSYKVKISRKKYMEMINSKYISVLLGMSQKTIFSGLNQIKRKYKKQISFEDKLICLVLNR